MRVSRVFLQFVAIAVLIAVSRGIASADWYQADYVQTNLIAYKDPAWETEGGNFSYTENSGSTSTVQDGVTTTVSMTTRRYFGWDGPGWPTPLTVHFSATAVGTHSGTYGVGASQATVGTSTIADNTTYGNYSDTWYWTSQTLYSPQYANGMDHWTQSHDANATAVTTALIYK